MDWVLNLFKTCFCVDTNFLMMCLCKFCCKVWHMGLCGFCFSKCLGLNFSLLQMSTFFLNHLNFIYFYIAIWLRDTLVSCRGWFGCDVSLRILVCYLVFVFVDNNKCGCQCECAWHVNMCIVFCAIIPRNLGMKNQYFCAIEKVSEAMIFFF